MRDPEVYNKMLLAGCHPALTNACYRDEPLPDHLRSPAARLWAKMMEPQRREHTVYALMGPTAAGKTLLAVRMAWRYMECGSSLSWLTPASLAREMASNFQVYSGQHVSADILVVDDVTSGSKIGPSIAEIIVARSEGSGITLLTSSQLLENVPAILVGRSAAAEQLLGRLRDGILRNGGLCIDLFSKEPTDG